MRHWLDRYQPNDDVFISVNVSSKQVSHGNLIEEIDEVLDETGLNPQHLRLEITESALVENTRSAAQLLAQDLLAAAVGGADEVARALDRDLEVLDLAEVAHEMAGGLAGRLHHHGDVGGAKRHERA